MKKAIVLGGTLPHVTLINKVKERGYEVLLVDYLDKPYAKPFADRHIPTASKACCVYVSSPMYSIVVCMNAVTQVAMTCLHQL